MQNKIVVLEKTIVGHRPYRQLEFREPTFRELMAFGDPWFLIPIDERYSRRVEDTQIIEKYARRLLVEDNGKGGMMAGEDSVLDQLGIVDTRKVRETVISFFRDAEPKEEEPKTLGEASNTSEGNSSSISGSMPEPSTA